MSFSSDIAISEPDILINQTNWRWNRDIPGFSADDYTLEYLLTQQIADGAHKITLTATADGSIFEIDFDSADSETNLEVAQIGNYSWQAFLIDINDTDSRTFFAKGVFDIQQRADLASDPRSHNEKMRDSILAFLEGRANVQDKKKKIGDREIELHSISELNEFLAFYTNAIAGEQVKDDICSGVPRTIQKIRTTYLGL